MMGKYIYTYKHSTNAAAQRGEAIARILQHYTDTYGKVSAAWSKDVAEQFAISVQIVTGQEV